MTNLPEFKFSGNFQLLKSGVKIKLQAFRNRKIRTVSLIPIFIKIGQMVSYNFTKSSKFCRTFILLTKLESSMGCHLQVDSLLES